MYSKTQKRWACGLNGNRVWTPSLSTTTISPGFTSRTYSAPMMSRAQVSAGEDVSAVQLAHHQRPHAVGIAHADQLLGGQSHQRIGAFHLVQRVDQLVDDARLGAARGQMDDGFGVRGGMKDRALPHQLGAQAYAHW